MSTPERSVFPSLLLARTLVGELAGIAEVSIDDVSGGLAVMVQPSRNGARAMFWYDSNGEVVLSVGEHGGRWELTTDDRDLSFLEDVVRSVIAGRIIEVLAPGRSRVIVVLADGSRAAETGYDAVRGCIPMPLWPRWSRTVRYLPYH